MEYLTTSEVAEKWGITARREVVLSQEGRIDGAVKKSRMWLIPDTTKKPEDRFNRFNTVKEKNKGHHENYNGVIAYKTLTEVKKMGMNGENGSNLYEDLQRKSRGKKSLIIVCDEKTVKYGNYLGQLISTNDDKEGDVVGVVDGTVEVAVWTEKEYKANKVKIPFSQHVIFIGENEVSKEETSSIPVLFDKFGMQYGWLGKRAKVNVTRSLLSAQEYNAFIQYCLGYQSKFDNAIMKTKIAGLDLKELEKMQDDPEKLKGLFAEQIKKETPKTQLKKLLPSLGLGLIPAVGPLAAAAVAAKTGVDIANSIKEEVDQQYRAVTSILYIEGLQSFLEG